MRVKDLMLKVAALAQNGIGGEKENAEVVLNRLLKSNNMTMADLESTKNEKKERLFSVKNGCKQLLMQIVCKVLDVQSFYSSVYEKDKQVGICLTDSEFIRVSMLFGIYAPAYQKEKKNLLKRHKKENEFLFQAFIYKHNIYPSTRNENKEQISQDDIMAILKQIRDLEDIQIREELPGRMLGVENDNRNRI